MRIESQKMIDEFLEDVDEQIQYKPMHAAVNEELRAHMEDKTEAYMEYGVDETEACKRAVRDMGDASALGIELNEAHHLRLAKPLLAVILVLVLLGIIRNVANYGIVYTFFSLRNSYFVCGLVVLAVVLVKGYPFLLKHAKGLLALFVGGYCALSAVKYLAKTMEWINTPNQFLFALFSPSVYYGLLQTAIPVAIVWLYRKRHNPKQSLYAVFVLATAVIYTGYTSYLGEYTFVPVLTLLCSAFAAELYMLLKGWLNVDRKKGLMGLVISFLVLLVLYAVPQRENLARSWEQAVHPEAQAYNAWEDAYNNVLIRDLLGKAEPFGEIELTEEELIRYGTGQWYFEDGPGEWNYGDNEGWKSFESHIDYQKQFLDTPRLEDILPQHHINNYRIAWWILRYGWIPGLLLTGLVLASCIFMFVTSFRIKNRLGRVVAFGSSMALSIQTAFYLLGNFGFQFGAFGNLPFVSEGLVSITGTMIMAGLVLSAYRFDTVITEERTAAE